MVDCSHANCGKDPARRPAVAEALATQQEGGSVRLKGAMLESYIAGPRGELGWLDCVAVPGTDYGFAELMSSVDTLLLGRNTYDVFVEFPEWSYDSGLVQLRYEQVVSSESGELPEQRSLQLDSNRGRRRFFYFNSAARGKRGKKR